MPSIPNGEVRAAGRNPTVLLSSDVPITVGQDGALYYPESGPGDRLRIMRFTASGDESARASLPSRSRGGALRWINGLAAGSGGSLYYTENDAVRRADERGSVFVAASGCGAVLKITPSGKITTVLQSGSPWSPTAVAVSPAGLYVLEYLHTASDNRAEWLARVRRVSPDGSVAEVAAVKR